MDAVAELSDVLCTRYLSSIQLFKRFTNNQTNTKMDERPIKNFAMRGKKMLDLNK